MRRGFGGAAPSSGALGAAFAVALAALASCGGGAEGRHFGESGLGGDVDEAGSGGEGDKQEDN